MIEGYIPKADRKKILLLCDDIRMHSGIATMAREFVVNLSHKYNWFQLGAALKHPDAGKTFDISQDVGKRAGINDADIKVMPWNGYGDAGVVRNLMAKEDPDAIFIFTDPRYWIWLFEIEREIRSKIPIFWLNIWDDYPAPMYNRPYYESVDLLMGISKQTVNINKLVLEEKANDKVIEYVPHGIDTKDFFPIREGDELYPKLIEFKKQTVPVETDFIVYFNSRNIHRKRPGDTLMAYKHFCDIIGEEKAKRTALVMHTQPTDNNGTDLQAMKNTFYPNGNIFFSSAKISPQQMNFMYNMADLTVLLSSNEGWGLALTESMMCGTMISANVTGGMQDQMRFVDDKGKWIEFDADFPSNHRGTYKEHGEWAIPVFPSNISFTGSPLTPYIYDDRLSPEDAAQAILKAYNLSKEERDKRGMKGHEWVMSDEAGMSSKNMSKKVGECMEKAFKNFKPRPSYNVIKIKEYKPPTVKHKIIGY
tara:strand:+ start:96 stop:1529 length:1434 start_codon:yes stop_codon:yes gene_type:complete